MKKTDLFSTSGDDVEEISNIEYDEEFGKRFEYNNKRKDLHRLEERIKNGQTSDSDDESDDSDFSEDEAVDDVKYFEGLLKIRNKDPSLLDKDYKLFDEEKGVGEEKKKKKKKEKKEYLKDVNAKYLLECGPDSGGEDDEEAEEEPEEDLMKVKSYAEEQEELRKAFLDVVDEDDENEEDGGGLLREKPRKSGVGEDEEEERKQKLDSYFGEDEKLDEKDLFLKEFFRKKMWKGNEEDEEEEIELSEDEEEIERQEDYEREYNFRFEEGAGDRVESHARFVGDSVRKVENPRKEQRKRKKERMEEAEKERREEVKRLKNVKKREIMEKMNKIKMVAGLGEGAEIPLTEVDLEDEFDPVKYDKKMSKVFGDEYYGLEDMEPDFAKDDEIDMEKPDFGKEDELLGLPKDWDVCKPGKGFSSERKKYLQTVDEGEDEGKEESENGEGERRSEGKRKRKRKVPLKEKLALDKEMEELYKLDYEDTIGDLKTRFRYKAVEPKRYGLTADELLNVDEKELNQVVSIKRLAPYREKEWVVPQEKLIALRNKKRDEYETQEGGKHKKKRTEEKEEQAIVDAESMSRKEKIKQRKRELKISESRLKAYGKIPSKANKKSTN